MHCGRDARAVASATHVFELFKDEHSWVVEVSSDCVNYIPGHIDTNYLDQASWIYDRMAASQRLKLSRPEQWNRPQKFTSQWCVMSVKEDGALLIWDLLLSDFILPLTFKSHFCDSLLTQWHWTYFVPDLKISQQFCSTDNFPHFLAYRL